MIFNLAVHVHDTGSNGDLVQETAPSNDGRAEDSVQESPISNNINKKRGITLMQRIWALPPNKKLVCGLNGSKQPVGESGQTFKSVLTDLFVLICWRECVKELVDTNKRSRSFQKDIARTGPISFAQTADNMAKENGQAVERADVFIKAYSKKDGTPISNEVRDKIDKMKEILNNGGKLVGDHRDGILWAKDDAFAQVMGEERSGRVRGVGFGPTPSGRSGSNLPCVLGPSSTETVQRMIALENSMRDQLADSEQRHQQQLAEALAEAKRESDARHEQQLAEALAEAKRESNARHEQQLAEAMRESETRHQQQLDETKREMADTKRRMDEIVAFFQKNMPPSSLTGYSGYSATS
ncbi:uncharacterized protein LOC126721267 [Quercus robur]|uniref:uncharacterized protein LOC126721267 n=1 Tax=Quercus robur TaxID=38942 RepID=UPI002161D4C3|nr:uncharacterized protein LOC126721267 [Quercus robur]